MNETLRNTAKPDWATPLPTFDFATIYNPFVAAKHHILKGLAAKVNSMPSGWESHRWFIISAFVETSFDATNAVCTLIGEKAGGKFATPALCISRGIFEALFNISALLDEPKERYFAFRRDEYKTTHESYRLRLAENKSDPQAIGWLRTTEESLKETASEIGLTPAEAAAPSSSFRWPTPWHLKAGIKDQNKKAVLDLFYTWHYYELSAAAHFRLYALMSQVYANDPSCHWEPGRQASNIAGDALTFFAAILTEVDSSLKLGANGLLREGWKNLCVLGPTVTDFYNARYRDLIPSS